MYNKIKDMSSIQAKMAREGAIKKIENGESKSLDISIENNPDKGLRENELPDDMTGSSNSAFLHPDSMLSDSLW